MTFPECNAVLRTDESFACMRDDDHHIKESPLLKLCGLVTQFPLDYMHLCCLGVMRRLLVTWLRGPLAVRLSFQFVTLTLPRPRGGVKLPPRAHFCNLLRHLDQQPKFLR